MTIHDIFDQTLKIIAREYTDVFLRLAFPGLKVRLLGTVQNVEIALPIRPVDFVHRVEYEGQEYLLHIEFQLRHDGDFPRRLCAYYGALTDQFDLPVLTLVLYLQPRQAAFPQAYEVALGEQVVNRFSYPVLRLWDYVDEIRNGTYRELAPLLLLLIPDEPEQVLREERDLILAEPDPQKRRDLLALAVTIATRHFDTRYLRQFFTDKEVDEMREATFIEELIADKVEARLATRLEEERMRIVQQSMERGIKQGMKQGIEQGMEQGIKQGAWQAGYEHALDVLAARFAPPIVRYRQIERKLKRVSDTEQLRHLLLTLVQADELSAFEQALEQIVPEQAAQKDEWLYPIAQAG